MGDMAVWRCCCEGFRTVCDVSGTDGLKQLRFY
jgi:hypothetical protein